ncbi:2,3-diphosphoglycerate-dependent phosphoglycerate mutase [Vagococcus xieshaowenii]|uniref:2,3-bisphosphoglycerate-dependent phosphoglycerate mutase n=1 Tax=Vagococcus xieshaowenii TaxID=2562451 RepID=A0AAJ5EF74_9ENTE|nr:2,3-diphosphoglycerate-dependent phosphoglycerate mutase [Vagococcus xieshaowenii]QCA29525.1 2,3-diphosphoglycerate-dependent phosphoglycerate mutase [Vagococcus xieshaowenii]TFZ42641.1 2,3-diphosphoglycerate-dependent phosphoglycerate mutase [Vagococcus xieshaowenii]
MKKVVVIRHGQSVWNLENRFTGWTDVPLSEQGIQEAHLAGQKIKEAHLQFDEVYTSVLQRAIRTAHIVMEEIGQLWVPEYKSWRLNERHYGALQGLNKQDTADKYGEEQVTLWRRSYDVLPPLLEPGDERSASLDPKYQHLDPHAIPRGESLQTTLVRTLPFWQDHIAPKLLNNETILIVAHGNSLRSIAMHLEGLTEEQILELEIPTGQPLVYELNDDLSFHSKYYLS